LKKKNERVKEVKEDEDSFFCCVVLWRNETENEKWQILFTTYVSNNENWKLNFKQPYKKTCTTVLSDVYLYFHKTSIVISHSLK
jgi:hypothetical protein